MGYSGQRFSPLTQINKENVGRLVPVWAYSLADLQGGESFPLVKDGVIYVTTHNATVAVDALSGKQIWRVVHDYPPETLRVVCCGIVNRGAAIYEGMSFARSWMIGLLRLKLRAAKKFGPPNRQTP
jgi:alcohol dehydrogenase (cytochrome c)